MLSAALVTLGPVIVKLVSLAIALEAAGFAAAALLHAGVAVFGITERRGIPEAIAQGVLAIGFATTAYAVIRRWTWAWTTAVVFHVLGLLGFLFGIAQYLGGVETEFELRHVYNQIRLALIVLVLVVLVTRRGRSLIRRR